MSTVAFATRENGTAVQQTPPIGYCPIQGAGWRLLLVRKPFIALPGREMTADHVIRLSRGGQDLFENIVAAHRRCNVAKGNLFPEEFSEPGRFFWKPKGVPILLICAHD